MIAVVIGFFVDGGRGAGSAAIGVGMAFVFLAFTAASILLANRFAANDMFVPIFFACVFGAWIVKLVVFIVLALVLKGQPWINPIVLFLSLVVGVLASLVVDVVVALRVRVPYASDATLPQSDDSQD